MLSKKVCSKTGSGGEFAQGQYCIVTNKVQDDQDLSEIISKCPTHHSPKLLLIYALSLITKIYIYIFSQFPSQEFTDFEVYSNGIYFCTLCFCNQGFCIALHHHTVYALFPLWTLPYYPTHSLAITITKVLLLACTSIILAIPQTINTQKPGCKDLPREPILYYKLFYTALHNVFT